MRNFSKTILKALATIILLIVLAVGSVTIFIGVSNYFAITYKMLAIYTLGGILIILGIIKTIELLISSIKSIGSRISLTFKSKSE